MNIIKTIKTFFQDDTQTTKVTKTPKFLLPETEARYEAIKVEILEKERNSCAQILSKHSEQYAKINKTIAENCNSAVLLHEEAKTLCGVARLLKYREALCLEDQARRCLSTRPHSPDVEQQRLKECFNRILRDIDSIAELEARNEEIKKICKEGERLHSVYNYDYRREVYFYRDRYFVWVWQEDYLDKMSDSFDRMTNEELKVVVTHEVKRGTNS